MTHYVAGFAFSSDGKKVVLIQKNRPKWQAGKLNGVGGHVEAGETTLAAMVREYKEETGITSVYEDWERFACVRGSDFSVHFFAAFNDSLLGVTSLTDEVVGVFPAPPFDGVTAGYPIISNLNWLIPLALDTQREGFILFTDAKYLA